MTDPTGTVADVAFQGRTRVEYEHFLALDPDGWTSILDCGAGPSSFAATVHDGIDVVAADPAYRSPVGRLRERCETNVERLASWLPELEERFSWSFYDDPADRIAYLERAHDRFIDDIGSSPSRYVTAALPRLPFRDDSFELALAAHLLFMYDRHLGEGFHRRAIAELCRVSRQEVRIYPLVSLDGDPSDLVDPVVAWLEDAGHDTERRSVPFEFQESADDVLVIFPA